MEILILLLKLVLIIFSMFLITIFLYTGVKILRSSPKIYKRNQQVTLACRHYNKTGEIKHIDNKTFRKYTQVNDKGKRILSDDAIYEILGL